MDQPETSQVPSLCAGSEARTTYSKPTKMRPKTVFLLISLTLLSVVSHVFHLDRSSSTSRFPAQTTSVVNQVHFSGLTSDHSIPSSRKNRLKIAIISNYVTRDGKGRISDSLLDHMVNKACYADLWGYDFIFNQTWAFDKDVGHRYWLELGHWHRVPQLQAALPNYDWIIWADTDWIIQDLTVPIESFIREWELRGMKNVSSNTQSQLWRTFPTSLV